jgi:ERO1-like protein beta
MSIANRPRVCPSNLDPMVFSSSTKPSVVEEFKNHFRNVSLIMDCVGCEKCRLWGKIQITGIGTALKILFASESPKRWENLNFRRSEIVALFNTLGRLSESVSAVQRFRECYQPYDKVLIHVVFT